MELFQTIIFRPISNSRQDDSPNRPSLDERLDIELGVNETTEDTQNIIDDPKLRADGYEIEKGFKDLMYGIISNLFSGQSVIQDRMLHLIDPL